MGVGVLCTYTPATMTLQQPIAARAAHILDGAHIATY